MIKLIPSLSLTILFLVLSFVAIKADDSYVIDEYLFVIAHKEQLNSTDVKLRVVNLPKGFLDPQIDFVSSGTFHATPFHSDLPLRISYCAFPAEISINGELYVGNASKPFYFDAGASNEATNTLNEWYWPNAAGQPEEIFRGPFVASMVRAVPPHEGFYFFEPNGSCFYVDWNDPNYNIVPLEVTQPSVPSIMANWGTSFYGLFFDAGIWRFDSLRERQAEKVVDFQFISKNCFLSFYQLLIEDDYLWFICQQLKTNSTYGIHRFSLVDRSKFPYTTGEYVGNFTSYEIHDLKWGYQPGHIMVLHRVAKDSVPSVYLYDVYQSPVKLLQSWEFPEATYPQCIAPALKVHDVPNKNKEKANPWLIVGVTTTIVIIVAVAISVACFVRKRRTKKAYTLVAWDDPNDVFDM